MTVYHWLLAWVSFGMPELMANGSVTANKCFLCDKLVG